MAEESTIWLILIIAMLTYGLLMPGGIGLDSGDGTAVDSIHGIEKTGWVLSNYKVYLTNDHGLANSDWNGIYSVDKNNKELIAQIQKASETYDSKGDKIKVRITYHTHMFLYGDGITGAEP